MKIKQFNRDSLRLFRPGFEQALAELGKEYGLAFAIGSMRFDATSFKTTLTAQIVGGEVQGNGKDEINKANFIRHCDEVGLQASDFGKIINYAGHEYKITGLKPRSYRFPVLVQRQPDGKGFKLPIDAVRTSLALKKING